MQNLHAQSCFTRESPKQLPRELSAGGPRRKRVLVMDDEIPILDLTVRLLATRGYEVETATDGGMAVERYRAAMEAGKPFDVVILDLTVPEKMGGYDAFKAMREFDPAVKAIVSSGYSHEPVVLNYRDYGIAGVAPKPYRVGELLGAVDAVVNG
jgi:CheY-like chemotaxis protein